MFRIKSFVFIETRQQFWIVWELENLTNDYWAAFA